MTTTILDNNLSWKRTGMIFAYYMPLVRKQIIWYLIVSTLAGILIPLLYGTGFGNVYYTLSWSALQFMFNFAPLVFAKSDSQAVETMIPARAGEKLAFYLLYTFVLIPAVTFGIPLLSSYIYILTGGTYPDVVEKAMGMTDSLNNYALLGTLQHLVPTVTCLYFVLRYRHNRILKGVIATFVAFFALSFIGGIWGAYMAFSKGFADGAGMRPANPDAIVSSVMSQMPTLLIIIASVSLVYFIIMDWLTYRLLKNRQI